MDGQGAMLLQQVGDLLGQLAQQETEPTIQRSVLRVMKELEPLMNLVGADDQQDMTSGLATPGGPPEAGAGSDQESPTGAPDDYAGAAPGGPGGPGMPPGGPGGGDLSMPGPPPDFGGVISSRGPVSKLDRSTQSGGSKSFKGARRDAMKNLSEKGSFSRSGQTETDRARNRRTGGRSLSQDRK
jgi:hypothetical protein